MAVLPYEAYKTLEVDVPKVDIVEIRFVLLINRDSPYLIINLLR